MASGLLREVSRLEMMRGLTGDELVTEDGTDEAEEETTVEASDRRGELRSEDEAGVPARLAH